MSGSAAIERSDPEPPILMQSALGLLSELSEEDVDWIFHIGFERHVTAGTIIVREGEPLACLCIVLEGLFAVRIASIPKAEIGRLGPGEIIGEISFLENTLPSATVTAIESSLLLEIPIVLLAERLNSIPSFGAQFYRALAILNSRRVRERVTSLTASFLAKLDASSLSGQTAKSFFLSVERFKSFFIEADAEALKRGGQISEETAENAKKIFSEFCQLIHTTIGSSSTENLTVKAELGARLRHEILPFVLLTRILERIYSKPRGNGEDFLKIDMIYRNEATGTGRIGPLLDQSFLCSPIAKAIRNRRDVLARKIMGAVEAKNNSVHVTGLACATAQEMFDVFSRLDDPARLYASLVDIDFQALAQVADRRNQANLQNRMNLINANLVYLALGRQKLELNDQDLIYSPGLTDYFNDKFVVQLLNWIYGRLRPGGRVVICNFHPNNYCKELMDYLLEWRLIHRSEEDMNRLYTHSAFRRPSTAMEFENEGINLISQCVKE